MVLSQERASLRRLITVRSRQITLKVFQAKELIQFGAVGYQKLLYCCRVGGFGKQVTLR